MSASQIERFQPPLLSRYHPRPNPQGEYVKYSDIVELIKALEQIANDSLPAPAWKFRDIARAALKLAKP